MATATAHRYGTVEFDPMNHDANCYDLYNVVICNPDTDEYVAEERYATEGEYMSAINGTAGRKVFDEQEEVGYCEVWYDLEEYECDCTRHIAYVYDSEEE